MAEQIENEVLFHENSIFESPSSITDHANLGAEEYEKLYAYSVEKPEKFWKKVAMQELDWFSPWTRVRTWNYPNYQWFEGATLNITHNCLDRHIAAGKGEKKAFIYTNEDGKEDHISYAELLDMVSRFANGLKSIGVKKGDRVAIYMALSIEQIIAMLGCARIGAIHNVVYGGFSATALRVRIEDSQAKVVVGSLYTTRRGKQVDLKSIIDEAVNGLACVENVIMDFRGNTNPDATKYVDMDTFIKAQNPVCPAEPMEAEHPLFILYTSGTTGKPKGVLHTTGGYNLFTHYTTKLTFDLKDSDIFWCTADTGWITGHSYIVYGPLSNGATSVIAEGAPDFPEPDRWWKIIEKFHVSIFYTAPTAVRLFMKHGEQWTQNHPMPSLRILGSVGEPINPEAWLWYYKNIGKKKCVVVDTWWQTETGGHMILSLPACKQKPGRAGRPFLGVKAQVVSRKGEPLPPDSVGLLVIKEPWPSALRTCWGEPERFNKYWNEMEGFYFAGDLATMDKDGYIMILGRADDVLNVSGHRIGTAEVESALVSHLSVAEAAVIGKPHKVKGESIKAFVILKKGIEINDALLVSVKEQVKHELGSLGVPDEIEFVEKLPKTRSGKIMRRVLKAKELGTSLGDVSTLEE